MKIIQLTAENFKRLTAVEIVPDGNTILLTGKNGAGKTSVLDAIWAVLSNPRSKELPKPIHDGEKKATITIKLDERDLLVKRVFTDGGTRLKIISKDGAVFKSPQALLDKFLGELSFDPLAFMQLSDKEQTRLLLSIVPLEIDLDELATERQKLYDERRVVNRTVEEAKAQLPFDPPRKVERVSIAELVRTLHQAQTTKNRYDDLESEMASAQQAIRNILAQIKALKDQNKTIAADMVKIADELREMVVPQIEPIQADLENAEEINRQADEYDRYIENKHNYEKRLADAESYTAKINAIDKQKAEAIGNATFPIDGLGFDEEGITYNGVPIKQISDAEQLRISVAIAMALNPELRVIRIRNGSLLDSDSLAIIEQMAQDKDFQIWIEKVDESGEIGIFIEDGQIKEQS